MKLSYGELILHIFVCGLTSIGIGQRQTCALPEGQME